MHPAAAHTRVRKLRAHLTSQDPPRVVSLFVYPVKSCRGIALQSATVTEGGFEHDREWMCVELSDADKDVDATFVTGRQEPALLSVQPSFDAAGELVLSAGTGPLASMTVPRVQSGRPIRVRVWQTVCKGIDQGDRVARFLTDFLGGERQVRLVRMACPDRQLSACDKYGSLARAGRDVSRFSDWSPFSIGSLRSLAWLNARLASPVPITRFRPNIVVDGAIESFAEETWARFRIGSEAGVAFRNVKCAGRCQMTTIDSNGVRDPTIEPLLTLKRLRACPYPHLKPTSKFFGKEAFFCCNLLRDDEAARRAVGADGGGVEKERAVLLRVGDPVMVTETKAPYSFASA